MQLDYVLAGAPVRWTDPRVRALHDAASTFVPYRPDIEQVTSAAGLRPGDLPLEQTGRRIWYAAFNLAATQLVLPQLIDQIEAFAPGFASRLTELRQETPPLPREASQPPRVDEYTGFSPAARQERQIVAGMPTLLDVRFLALGIERAKSVCRIEARFANDVSLGTGFRIGEHRILTNHHVVFDEDNGDSPAQTVQVQFGKELGVDGKPLHPITVNAHAGAKLRGERAHDWAVVELIEPPPFEVPVLAITGPARPVVRDDRVVIIQHPRGLDKKIALTHNLVRSANDEVIQYWTDTDEGSSGSPVFNETWEVVALHHASVELGSQDEYGYCNQGRTIALIADRVAQIAG
jgi:S1-C subfamily serine protease